MVTFEAVVSYRHVMCKGDSCFCKKHSEDLQYTGPVRTAFEEALADIRAQPGGIVIEDNGRKEGGIFTGAIIRVDGIFPEGEW